MNEPLRIFSVIVLLTLGLAAYLLVIGALFAARVAKAKRVISQMPGRSFWVGLVNFVFFAVIAALLLSLAGETGPVLKTILNIPALVIIAMLAVTLSFGLAGMVNLLGERLFPDNSGWKKTGWGTVILCFACAVPFAGWFLLLPYAGLTGFGAVILGLFQRNDA